ncbi:nuclear transport factor 2 family protein [Fulvivirga sp. 29W222]|uniref:Nuclear transport factor 2 family protein n=1 Tax=Fulvivirga marina TaxID=2494733 RepID=A0A937KB53_9BACT|nr:nuclear transport factor 2 family protein [Fulvivirga marina]MBL6445607.1 nuclear transport factor 2 family protein [Fulvivirga marina]
MLKTQRTKIGAKSIVDACFNALAMGDITKALTYFASDVKWNQPGNSKFSGIKNSPDEIEKMIVGMTEEVEGNLVIKLNGLLQESGDLVAVPIRFTAAKCNQSVDMGGLFEVRDGEIAYAWLFSEDKLKEDGLWAK